MQKELNRIVKTLKVKEKDTVKSDEELIDTCQTQKRRDVEVDRWCKCGLCVKMETNKECLCCVEIDEIKYKKLSGKI